MATVEQHYENHLADVYVWMAGGFESAVARGASELEALGVARSEGGVAVDLGAGFGMHAIPLAARGYSVTAIDSSRTLLDVLAEHAEELPVRPIEDDLRNFDAHLHGPPTLFLCMGDTLTHLPDLASVESLLGKVHAHMAPGTRLVLSFRDYSSPLVKEERFIPVRSDANTLLTCFLEYSPRHVTVYDILHRYDGFTWNQTVSWYEKVRLSPAWVVG
ncbi:MAG: class I SAM-dependent methyltransferase, partial [Myxococcota bacterium]